MSRRRKPPTRTVTVCAACRTEACWRGEMTCEDYRTAGTVEVEVPGGTEEEAQ